MSWLSIALIAFLFCAMIFGGGGAEGELNNGFIDAGAAILLFVLVGAHLTGQRPLPKVAIVAIALLLSLQVILLLQLVPLPAAVWAAFPGRQLPAAAVGLTPMSNHMRPLSLDPEATRRFCAALFLPAAILLGAVGAAKRDLRLLLWAVVAAGVVTALVGSLQLALGSPHWLSFYDGPSLGAASGVFANPNHQAAFLCGALFALALLLRLEEGQLDLRPLGLKARVHAGWILFPVFAIMVIATGSRAGAAALPGALVASLIVAVRMRSAIKLVAVIVLVALIVGLAILYYPSDNSLALRENFLFGQDIRYAYLPDIRYTLGEYWPYGSGFGTFRTVFQHNETLDIATAGVLNHAHNDALEWLIEGGIAGAVWLGGLILVGAGLFYKGVTSRREQGRGVSAHLAITGALLILTICLMSLVDYPMRTRAVLAVCSLAFALLLVAVKAPALQRVAQPRRGWIVALFAIAGVAVGAQTFRIQAAQAAVWAEDAKTAVALRPQNGQALSLAAETQLVSGNIANARALAIRAIDRAPLDARAVRTIAISSKAGSAESAKAWTIAATMGWRDPPTQVWAMRQAFHNGEYEVAALRADALLRTGHQAARLFLGEVRSYAERDGFRRQLIPRLVLKPSWRASFFQVPADIPQVQLDAVIATLKNLMASATRPSSAETRAAISALIKRGQFQEAWSLYRSTNPAASKSTPLLTDGAFALSTEDYKTQTTPFDWTIATRSGANASVEAAGQRTLLISTDGETKAEIVTRYLGLPPGQYVLTYQTRGDRASPEGVAIVASCATAGDILGQSSPAPLSSETFETGTMTINVPLACPFVRLVFETQSTGSPTTAEFDNLQLRSVPHF